MTKHSLHIKARNTDLDKKLERYFNRMKVSIDQCIKKDADFYNIIKRCYLDSEIKILQFNIT